MKTTVNARPYPYLWVATAVILSWSVNQSVWWAILHGFLSMFYVVYWVIKYSAVTHWIASNWVF